VNAVVDSGADVLAHTVPQSPTWTPAFVSRLKSANISIVPTLTLFDFEARKENGSDGERDAWIAKMVSAKVRYTIRKGTVVYQAR
jgi:hypothetical protein